MLEGDFEDKSLNKLDLTQEAQHLKNVYQKASPNPDGDAIVSVFDHNDFDRLYIGYTRDLTSKSGISVESIDAVSDPVEYPLIYSDFMYFQEGDTRFKNVGELDEPPSEDDMEETLSVGIYKVTFSTGLSLFVYQNSALILVLGTKQAHHQLREFVGTAALRDAEPGVYSVIQKSIFEREIVKKKEFHAGGKVHHQSKDKLLEEVNNFFGQLSMYLDHGGDGTRSILLYGPPGTGKTEILRSIVDNHREDKVTAITSSIDNANAVYRYAAQDDMPAVIAVEDAEDAFESPSSDVLNWMDGAERPRNEGGTIFLYTTNKISNISGKIMRPGRIDTKIHFGPLEEVAAMRCANYYLPDDISFSPEDIFDLIINEPGSIIQDMIRRARRIAASAAEELQPKHVQSAMDEIIDQKEKQEEYSVDL